MLQGGGRGSVARPGVCDHSMHSGSTAAAGTSACPPAAPPAAHLVPARSLPGRCQHTAGALLRPQLVMARQWHGRLERKRLCHQRRAARLAATGILIPGCGCLGRCSKLACGHACKGAGCVPVTLHPNETLKLAKEETNQGGARRRLYLCASCCHGSHALRQERHASWAPRTKGRKMAW